MEDVRDSIRRNRMIRTVLDFPGPRARGLASRLEEELGSRTDDLTGFMKLLTASLVDSDPGVRTAAAEMVAQFAANALPQYATALSEESPAIVSALEGALHDADPAVRTAAAKAAGRWKPGAARLIPLLSLATEDPNNAVREAAVRSISTLGKEAPSAAAEALITIVGQANRRPPALVELAIRQLTNCGPDAAGSASPALVAVLADRRFDPAVQLAAAETLRWLGPEATDVVDRLVGLITAEASDVNEQVRTVAAAAVVATAVDPAEIVRHLRNTTQRARLVEALRRVGAEATAFRRAIQASWTQAPPQPEGEVVEPADAPVAEAGDTGAHRLAALEAGVAEIKQLLESKQQRPTAKEWYTVKEAAELTELSEWTLRQACNTGRITGEKGPDGKWRISRETLREIQNRGLPADPHPE